MANRSDARVLIVDDEPANVALLRLLLTKAGFTNVQSTTDSCEVWSLTTNFEPDLILLDLHMPHLDGFEVLEAIDGLINGPIPIPVLVLTADITEATRERALRLGARDFVSKPFRLAELIIRIGNLAEARLTALDLSREVVRTRAQLSSVTNDDDSAGETRAIHRRIDVALRDRALFVAEQPIVAVESGTIVGYEALARFPTPPIESPDVWFRRAHEVGLGVHLELAALEMAVADLERIGARRFVSINVSAETLRSPALLLALEGVDPSRVVLELTETQASVDYRALGEAVVAVRRTGIRIAADDTGTGFASFEHLLAVRPDFIKLDRAIVAGIDLDAGRRSLAVALVAFARDIGAEVVAEGVESESEYDAVSALRVPYAQGFYIGRPEPIDGGPRSTDHLKRVAGVLAPVGSTAG